MKITPTLLQSYFFFRTQDWMTSEKMDAAIRGDFEENEKMLVGRALHEALESERSGVLEADGYVFKMNEFESNVPAGAIPECSARCTVGNGHTLSGRIDHLWGTHGHETKVTHSSIRADAYHDTMQARCYLKLFELSAVTFHIFYVKMVDKDPRFYEVKDYREHTVYRYPELDSDLDRWCNDLARYCGERLAA